MRFRKPRDILKKVLWNLGYTLESHRSIFPIGSDPREIPYLKNLPYSVQGLPTELGAGLRFFSLSEKTFHPYLLALHSFEKEGMEGMLNILKEYSKRVTYQSANHYLGFSEGEVFAIDSHPFAFTYPWSAVLPEKKKEDYIKIGLEENKKYGLYENEFLEGKYTSETKIEIEAKRLFELLHSIKENGYKPQDHDALNCFVLVKEGRWRWYIESGQHRAVVLAFLKFREIPVHVRQIVRFEEAFLWPAVQSGIFSEEAAIDLFQRMWVLEPPSIAQKWIDYVKDNF